MTVIPFPDSHDRRDEPEGPLASCASPVEGHFQAPTGRGRLSGSFRLSLGAVHGNQLYAAGVITAELFDADGTSLGLDSRRVGFPIDVVQIARRQLTAQAAPLEFVMLGLAVRVNAFELVVPLDTILAIGCSGPAPTPTR